MGHKRRLCICLKCHEEHFHHAKGLCDTCYQTMLYKVHPELPCQNARRYRLKHLEKVREICRQWRENNKEAARISRRKTHERYQESERAYKRQYRLAHLEDTKARTKRWKHENLNKLRDNEQRRRTRAKGLVATLTGSQWAGILKAYRYRCAYCGKHVGKLTQDHVIPIVAGGAYSVENIVPACRACNSSKGPRLLLKPPSIRLMI